MNKLVMVLVSLLAAFLTASGQTAISNTATAGSGMVSLLQSELSKLDLQNPENDLNRNLANGDRRLIGIYGYSLHCPGAEKLPHDQMEQYGIKPINGTSDCITGGEHRRLIQSVTDYAARYNQALIQRLDSK